MPHKATLTMISSLMLLVFGLSTGCSYLDEEIHLSDEEFELGVSGFGTSGSGSFGSGCGGGHMSYGHKSVRRVRGHLDLGELAITGELSPDDVARLDLPPRHITSDSFTLTEPEEDEVDEQVLAATNHDIITHIASTHAHP